MSYVMILPALIAAFIFPLLKTCLPFMRTALMPEGVLPVSLTVFLSRMFFQPIAVMSAARPSFRKPQSLMPYRSAAVPDVLTTKNIFWMIRSSTVLPLFLQRGLPNFYFSL
jgi:hypothetical protein